MPWCERCDQTFGDLNALENHYKDDPACNPEICSCKFTKDAWVAERKERGQTSNQIFHTNHILVCENRKNYKCEICSMGFNAWSHLSQ